MKFVVARRIGRMGGLGNELFSWLKGRIASQVLEAKLVGPSWGLTKYKYHRNFGASRFDLILENLLTHLSSLDLDAHRCPAHCPTAEASQRKKSPSNLLKYAVVPEWVSQL